MLKCDTLLKHQVASTLNFVLTSHNFGMKSALENGMQIIWITMSAIES